MRILARRIVAAEDAITADRVIGLREEEREQLPEVALRPERIPFAVMRRIDSRKDGDAGREERDQPVKDPRFRERAVDLEAFRKAGNQVDRLDNHARRVLNGP
ncbi:hypothetical protein JXB02_04480 [Candidatus Woesearchaeota archaeon]|nr:hypothetical protein [Candidatus Woesearchaeota archaeon]